MRDAEASGTDDSGEAAEGVGEFIGILKTASKELVLGMTGESGDEFEMEFLHGSGSFDRIKMSVEGAEEGVG